MPAGTKWLNLTLPVAAFLGSSLGSIAAQRAFVRPPAPAQASSAEVATPTKALPIAPSVPNEALFPDSRAGDPYDPPTATASPIGERHQTKPDLPGNFDDAAPPAPGSTMEATPAPATGEGAEAEKPSVLDAELEMSRAMNRPLPPGYFDLPPTPTGPNAPPLLQPGLMIQVEVLEALPGRPIGGERLIRADGTISLGFYGDLSVAGLNRYQAKVRLLEHLHQFTTAQVLGFYVFSAEGHVYLRPAVDSDRVYIDETIYYDPKSARPVPPTPDGTRVDRRVEANNPSDKPLFGIPPTPAPTTPEPADKDSTTPPTAETPTIPPPNPPAPAPAQPGAKPSS